MLLIRFKFEQIAIKYSAIAYSKILTDLYNNLRLVYFFTIYFVVIWPASHQIL